MTHDPIITGMARALFVSAFAAYQEELKAEGEPYASPGGGDWMTVAPETPLHAICAAYRLAGALEQANAMNLWAIYARSCVADGDETIAAGPLWEDDERQRLFGHYIAMQALGHGVSWFDDHASFELVVPSIEYQAEFDAEPAG